MKTRHQLWLPLAWLVGGLAPLAVGADLFWDIDGEGSAVGGTGDWVGDNRWRSGSEMGTLGPWSGSSDAFLGGTAGTINLNSGNVTAGSLTVTSTGYEVITSAASRSLTVTGALTLDPNVLFTLEKSGTGGDQFSVGSISGGTGSELVLASGVSSSVFELELTQGSTVSIPITVSGTGSGNIGILSNAAVILSGGISNSSSASTFLKANSGDDLTIQSTGISGSSGLVFGDGSGAGTIRLDVASNYGGGTTVNTAGSGTVELGLTDALPTGTALTMTQGSLDLQGFDQAVGSLEGAGGTITGSAGAELSVTGSDTTSFSGLISGSAALSKSGSGTLTLSGANGYSGTTDVDAGTLVINGDHSSATGAVTVGNSAKFAGVGDLGGDVNVESGGSYSPGAVDSVGSQGIGGNLAFEAGSIFNWDLNDNSVAMGFDTVSVTGNIDVSTDNTTFAVLLGSGVGTGLEFWDSTRSWTMAAIFGEDFNTGGFQNVTTNLDVSGQGSFSINSTSLTWNPVPEPGSALIGLLLGAGLLRRRRTMPGQVRLVKRRRGLRGVEVPSGRQV